MKNSLSRPTALFRVVHAGRNLVSRKLTIIFAPVRRKCIKALSSAKWFHGEGSLSQLAALTAVPGSLVHLTGPRGEGKTKLLHAVAHHLNSKGGRHRALIIHPSRYKGILSHALAMALPNFEPLYEPDTVTRFFGDWKHKIEGQSVLSARVCGSSGIFLADWRFCATQSRATSGDCEFSAKGGEERQFKPDFAGLSFAVMLKGSVDVCKSDDKIPVLLVAGASGALAPPAGAPASADGSGSSSSGGGLTAQASQHAHEALEVLTLLSVQERRLSVVLESSDPDFPSRLESAHPAAAFSPAAVTHTLVVGEMPEGAMRAALAQEWGCGPALTEALISCYGGSVALAAAALDGLAVHGEAFRGVQALSARGGRVVEEAWAAVLKALGVSGSDECVALMRDVAETGFALVGTENGAVAARVLEGAGLAWRVRASDHAPFVPARAWEWGGPGQCAFPPTEVLVPASTAARLLFQRWASVYDK